MTCFFTYLKRGLFHMKYEYHKTISEILDDYLQENYPNDCRKETIEKATYEIYDYTEGAYFSSDCSKVPMTMINGSIEFSPSYDELLNLDFILFICGNEIQVMSVIAIHLFTLRANVILSLVFLRLLISYNTFPVVF